VHGPSLALAETGGLTEQLGHDFARIGPARETMAVVAVGADDVVIRSKGRHGSDRDSLFADIEVEETGDLGERVHLRRLLFESADQQHLTVQ